MNCFYEDYREKNKSIFTNIAFLQILHFYKYCIFLFKKNQVKKLGIKHKIDI